ncbi:hypothetical protein [Spirillospora sp. CA-294931]|uniref:hypothetical protein n=1 Tax=Spirillospora sp. CA-294931 TaxID=3240042 RepID=UPI003D8DF6AE
MKKKILGGSVLGAGLGLAALFTFSGLASAETGGTPKVTVTCGIAVAPPEGPAGKGAVSSAERAGGGTSSDVKGAPSISRVEMKDGKLSIDGKEHPMPADCDGKPLSITVADDASATKK